MFIIFSFLRKPELIPMARVSRHWWFCSRQSLLWQHMDFIGFRVKSLRDVNMFLTEVFSVRPYLYCRHQTEQLPHDLPVRTLRLPHNCTGLVDTEFATLRRLCSQLHDLTLPNVHQSGDASNTQSINDSALREIAGIKTLRRLNLSTHEQVTDDGLRYITQECDQLSHIILDHCRNITPLSIQNFLRGCGTFRHKIKSISAMHCLSCSLTSEHLLELSVCVRILFLNN
jgi:hypothetical protein